MRVINRLFTYACLFILISCSVVQKGYYDENGQYRPKNDNYSLSNNAGHALKNLRYDGVYTLVYMVNNDSVVYPNRELNFKDNSTNYIKFYPNGRCLFFTISHKSEANKLKESDLNPNSPNYNKNYYQGIDTTDFYVESFVEGDGQGYYVKVRYSLSESGDMIEYSNEGIRMIYRFTSIPNSWQRFNIDW